MFGDKSIRMQITVTKKIGTEDAEHEGENIQNKIIFSEDTALRIKRCGNGSHTDQDGKQPNRKIIGKVFSI